MTDRTAIRLAVDIGGTFTDVVLDTPEGRYTRKVLTTPSAPEEGVMSGAALALQDARTSLSDVDEFVHGTTLATNAIIERRGAKTALIGTEGFRDVIEIGTESRFNQYDLMLRKPAPLVPRALRFTAPERMDARGQIRKPLDEGELLRTADELRKIGIESVAIAFLHSYANHSHETRARDILSTALPHATISISSEVCPEVREYERTSTTVANAYVQPLMAGYLGRLRNGLSRDGFKGALYLVTSSGALTSLETASQFPVRLVESGPAGGAIFAAQCAQKMSDSHVLSFDMGGTTAKVCLVEHFRPTSSRTFEVDRTTRFMKGSGLPLRIPVIEMVEIGAGGGSIAHLDAMKRITVGPESASSVPGPACYGLGGVRPAVTDADIALGLLRPEGFAGGSMTLRPELAKQALLSDIGEPLGLTAEMAAHAVYEMVCENMASAARVHAVERGVAIAEHTMIAFGGAAPLHAARVAEKLGVRRLVIPSNAGVGSAVGFLAAPLAFEIVRSHPMRIDDSFNAAAISALLGGMADSIMDVLTQDSRRDALRVERNAFMRYVGQGHEITVRLPNDEAGLSDVAALRAAFEQDYARQFSRAIPGAAVEVMNWSVTISAPVATPEPYAPTPLLQQTQPDERCDFFSGDIGAIVDLPVYYRKTMRSGSALNGPALIREDETTTYVSARYDAHIDGSGNIVLTMKDSAA
ncbi:N-methylhydantoinase A [Acetobacter nitrogenifigens DSM 23921 = NBRC 105050]|uniref:Methylhydantoinase n=1 Tax=Acetobacter nitrogenifigens DSM 23921 = NBRC 105050 TaxID=1120919 RepID=A0A511XC08_9PROT|nr:hydantoinase/oxoprolinase family protein [Acetobacter nitrogenifigens]GBQ88847.1 N-methylhydantoinase A [Acetobacter nitrogenifigens DSM 23921 = NBRC 105050]GEN60507.1 methylhydantoinase [Acetobacter nitrogenifigens DSM 23921 = NBRC 105050]